MINRTVAILAFLMLTGFLGILLWFVPRLDLAVVVVLTLLLAFIDLYQTAGERDHR